MVEEHPTCLRMKMDDGGVHPNYWEYDSRQTVTNQMQYSSSLRDSRSNHHKDAVIGSISRGGPSLLTFR